MTEIARPTGILPQLDSGIAAGPLYYYVMPYLVMPYVETGTLRERRLRTPAPSASSTAISSPRTSCFRDRVRGDPYQRAVALDSSLAPGSSRVCRF